MVADKIREVQQYQHDIYVLTPMEKIQEFILERKNPSEVTDDDLWRLSLRAESKKLNSGFFP